MNHSTHAAFLVCVFTACGDGKHSSADSGMDADAGDTVDAATLDGASDATGDTSDAVPDSDRDDDGLPDEWELTAGDMTRLDPDEVDSDDDGLDDGEEDYDGDGLSNLEELGAALEEALTTGAPHPFRTDLLVELDAMGARELPTASLAVAVNAFAALPMLDGDAPGVALHMYLDETDIDGGDFAGGLDTSEFLLAHDPATLTGAGFPAEKLVHVVLATRNAGEPTKPAETVHLVSPGDVEATGVFIWSDAIEETHPACDGTITVEDAFATALIHEIGHTLQLGHDTDVGGGVNLFNIMSLATTCDAAAMRTFGEGNVDATLGATESVDEPRFSAEAAALMDFSARLSVDTAVLADEDGIEM